MIDILFALFFGWALTFIHLDEAVLEALEAWLNTDLTLFTYYGIFFLLGLASWLLYKLQGIRLRD